LPFRRYLGNESDQQGLMRLLVGDEMKEHISSVWFPAVARRLHHSRELGETI
jgi:hypothetical protein